MKKKRNRNSFTKGPKKLVDVTIDELSIVDKGANNKVFLFTKNKKKRSSAMKIIQQVDKQANTLGAVIEGRLAAKDEELKDLAAKLPIDENELEMIVATGDIENPAVLAPLAAALDLPEEELAAIASISGEVMDEDETEKEGHLEDDEDKDEDEDELNKISIEETETGFSYTVRPVEDFVEGSLTEQPVEGEEGLVEVGGVLNPDLVHEGEDAAAVVVHMFVFDKANWDMDKVQEFVNSKMGSTQQDEFEGRTQSDDSGVEKIYDRDVTDKLRKVQGILNSVLGIEDSNTGGKQKQEVSKKELAVGIAKSCDAIAHSPKSTIEQIDLAEQTMCWLRSQSY